MLLKINQKAFNGTCDVDLQSGYALYTYFIIKCIDWIDIDGYIRRYEFFGIWFITLVYL